MNYPKLALMLTALIALPAAADVGVSISIGEPGFYGQLDIGDYGRPQVIYAQPVVIRRMPRGEMYEPQYLRVPRNHSRNWRRYCSRYDACGRPVYFVRDDWYSNVYSPRYREQHRHERRDDRDDHGKDRGRKDDRDHKGNRHDHQGH